MNSSVFQALEKECASATGRTFRSWLQNSYQAWGLSTRLIGELLGVSYESVCSYMERYGIPRRGKNEMMILKWKYENGLA